MKSMLFCVFCLFIEFLEMAKADWSSFFKKNKFCCIQQLFYLLNTTEFLRSAAVELVNLIKKISGQHRAASANCIVQKVHASQ